MQGVEATPPKSGGRRAPTQKQAVPSTSKAKKLGRGKAPKPEKKADAPSDVLEMIRKLLEVFGHLPPPYDQLSVLTSVLNKSVSTLKDTRHRTTSWTAEVIKETQTWATTLGAFYKDHGSTGSLIRMVTEAGERLVEDVAQDHGITAIKASQEVYHHMDHVNEAIRAQVSDIMAKARADIAAKLRETPAPPGPGLEAQLQQAAGAAGGGQEANPGINPELQ
ncbi:hypothetical protein V8C86DRAFT_3147192 [Haematococcus lacustris]